MKLLPKTRKKIKPASSLRDNKLGLSSALIRLQEKLKAGEIKDKKLRKQIGDRFDLIKSASPKIEKEKCRKSLSYWINNWVWTLDPRIEPKTLPFILFPRQEEYLQWRAWVKQNKENGICEKSRDMGVSWLNISDQTYCWLFEEGYQGGLGSRKQELVDRIGDPKSLFEKIRMLLRNLPPWMLPNDFDWRRDDNFLKLINPENGATITGEAGDNIGRGGRTTIYDVDEAAFIERPLKVDAALSNNTNTIIYTSSANGTGNLFYKKRSEYPPECLFRFYWREDPRKDDQWRAAQDKKYEPVVVASEVEIDYGASVEGIFIPANLVLSAVKLELPKINGKRTAALDVATEGKNRNVFGIKENNTVIHIEYWQGLDTTQTAYKVVDLMRSHSVSDLIFDGDGVGAGIAGTLNNIPDLEFNYIVFHGAGRPSDRWWNALGKYSHERFANARAEGWGILEERFRKAYDHVTEEQEHDLDELISIPNEPLLLAQLSMPIKKYTSTGKILVESKVEMKKRGIESPDYADMLMMLFHPLAHNDYEFSASYESLEPRETFDPYS